jgi:hypothetical protein
LTRRSFPRIAGGTAGSSASAPDRRSPSGRRPSGWHLEIGGEGSSLPLSDDGDCGSASVVEADVELVDRWDRAHGEIGSIECAEGGPSTNPTDNLFGVARPIREDGGLQGSQTHDSLKGFADRRRPALHGLQGLGLCIEKIHGLEVSFAPNAEAPTPLHTGGFPGVMNRDSLVKATAASLRDFSTICNIIARSKARLMPLARFTVGEEAIGFGLVSFW